VANGNDWQRLSQSSNPSPWKARLASAPAASRLRKEQACNRRAPTLVEPCGRSLGKVSNVGRALCVRYNGRKSIGAENDDALVRRQLLHSFYAGNNAALEQLAARLDSILARVAHLILLARAKAMPLALDEWVIDDRLSSLWAHVYLTRLTNISRWPHQQISGLRWLISLLCQEMDRNMGLRGPF
jgi:hypothetical protein